MDDDHNGGRELLLDDWQTVAFDISTSCKKKTFSFAHY